MYRFLVTTSTALMLFSVTASPLASGSDLPEISGAAEKTASTQIHVECTPGSSPTKATCQISRASLKKGVTYKEATEMLTLGKTEAEAFELLRGSDICRKVAAEKHVGDDIMGDFKALCAATSLQAFSAIIARGAKRMSQTCRLDQTSLSWAFERLDANRWRHVHVTGFCNLTYEGVLHRPSASKPWSYTQTRRSPPGATDTCAAYTKPVKEAFSESYSRNEKVGCEYLGL